MSSQSATSNNTTSAANSIAPGRTGRGNNNVAEEVDSSNDTMRIASMHTIWSQAANNATGAAPAVVRMFNNTANTSATNASGGTMQGALIPLTQLVQKVAITILQAHNKRA